MKTLEEKKELLKNSILLRVQKNPEWQSEVEAGIKQELFEVLQSWKDAAKFEMIGPKEVVSYIDIMAECIHDSTIHSPEELKQVGESI